MEAFFPAKAGPRSLLAKAASSKAASARDGQVVSCCRNYLHVRPGCLALLNLFWHNKQCDCKFVYQALSYSIFP